MGITLVIIFFAGWFINLVISYRQQLEINDLKKEIGELKLQQKVNTEQIYEENGVLKRR